MTSTHTHADSSEEDEVWARTDFSGLRDPEAMRRFLAVSDYCFGYSNSDDEGTYDPTRECFHDGLGMPSTGNEDEGQATVPRFARGQATPHLHALSHRQHGTGTLPLDNFDART